MTLPDVDFIVAFLLTPLREGRLSYFSFPAGVMLFLLTPLREGRPASEPSLFQFSRFLLTPLREGRHLTIKPWMPLVNISTHAPAGGATRTFQLMTLRSRNFYSRPCGRGDHDDVIASTLQILISTHAPAGGATRAWRKSATSIPFLLTPLREGRPASSASPQTLDSTFLLTPLREGRLPRNQNKNQSNAISTHAPAGGATITGSARADYLKISTPAPAGGATPSPSARAAHRRQRFLLTPLREGRRSKRRKVSRTCQFLLTPLREGRREAQKGRRGRKGDFYSRPCGRGDC